MRTKLLLCAVSLFLLIPFTAFADQYDGGDGDGWSMGEMSGDQSLPVALSSFTATASDGEVTLHWVTESSVDHVGFNVYRSASADGIFVQLNSELIEGIRTSSSPHTYAFSDL
ncbi:MAG: hypothetical protein V1800_04000 [Candidatus Latescibacterota bacterium]